MIWCGFARQACAPLSAADAWSQQLLVDEERMTTMRTFRASVEWEILVVMGGKRPFAGACMNDSKADIADFRVVTSRLPSKPPGSRRRWLEMFTVQQDRTIGDLADELTRIVSLRQVGPSLLRK